jgi:hypothetical protein
MLLARLSAPTKAPPKGPPLYCGVRRVNESRRSLMVGSESSRSRVRLVAAPVRSEEKTASEVAVTVISSLTPAARSDALTSLATPSVRKTPFTTCDWKPDRETVTV